ncbi:hypothetical protein D9C73_002267 [Collichthys lucidus]|uniref:Ameloblastin n=1 Tax=Collichthys lucidus TaxID=240159 RepID=A0A4U5U296_COLLU|nr:hypothetical protein D9C73_002267 [Collichthys lucidus]
MNRGLANAALPGIMAGGMNPPVLAGGGAGFFRQPQFAQGIPGGAMQQQPPFQPDPLRRFRRQIMKQDGTSKNTVDTQILRLNGLTLAALGQAQASSLLPQYVLQQQQPEVLLTPQVVNLNPQMAGPFSPQGPQLFLPNQGNPFTPMLVPNGQQEQLGGPVDPNAPNVPQQAQNPVQGFSYFMPSYGTYPQQRNNAVLQPNNGQQQTLERTTQRPQLPLQTWPMGTQKESTTLPPDPRGDASGPGIDEAHSNFPFLFEP